jgi:hypothetical protein
MVVAKLIILSKYFKNFLFLLSLYLRKLQHLRLNHENTFSYHEKNLYISIHFLTKSFVDGSVKVTENRTMDLYLTINREIETQQHYFENNGCSWFRM